MWYDAVQETKSVSFGADQARRSFENKRGPEAEVVSFWLEIKRWVSEE